MGSCLSQYEESSDDKPNATEDNLDEKTHDSEEEPLYSPEGRLCTFKHISFLYLANIYRL